MTTWFDVPTFAASVRARRGQRSLREASSEIGTVSSSTLSRIERGAVPDLETFLRLCGWLQLPMSTFIHSDFSSHDPQSAKDSAQLVEQALRVDGVLSPQVISAFITLLEAVRSPNR